MTAKIIDGKAYAEGLRARIAKAVTELQTKHGLKPGLAVVLVGEDPASKVYVANKAKQTVDQAERTKLYEQAQVVFKKEAPWATLDHSVVVMPMSKKVCWPSS